MRKLNYIDIEELACEIIGLDYDEIDADTTIIDEALIDKYGLDIEQFTELINDLIHRIAISESPISNEKYKGFLNNDKNMWLTKIKI